MSEFPDPKDLDKNRASILSNSIFQIFIVLIAGFILATLFTFWTPGIIAETDDQPPQIAAQAPQPTQASEIITTTASLSVEPRIGIVSGHWGHDSGAVCADGLTEAEVNQTIATLVQKYLVDLGYQVDLLREFDQNVTGYSGLALVSIHADSCQYLNDQATGFKVATALARSNKNSSTRLTSCIRNRYAQVTGLPNHSTSLTPDMTSYHAFAEIADETPAAIIETGFMNLDRQFLTEHPDLVARGIVDGILCFVNNESISPTATPETP